MNLATSMHNRASFGCAGLLLLLALAMGAAGCGSAGGSDFLGVAGMRKEYRVAAAKLRLPPGIVFPKMARSGGGASFEAGVGAGQAQWYWISAWEQEWLEQRAKNPARAQEALDFLKNEAPKSEYMTKRLDETGRQFHAEYLKKAELGDPSGFQRDTELNGVKLLRGSK